MVSLASQLMRGPVGAGLLALLEVRERDDVGWTSWDCVSSAGAVAKATESVDHLDVATVSSLALQASSAVSPWNPDADLNRELFLASAEGRRVLAESFARRFGTWLTAPLDRRAQEVWLDVEVADQRASRLFHRYEDIYGEGQFTWAGLWSSTSSTDSMHDELLEAWELSGPTERWSIALTAEARVFPIDSPTDWRRLIEEHPDVTTTSVPRRPDWSLVAQHWDGLHLSWAGFLTAHDELATATACGVIPLSHWGSERALWLNPVIQTATTSAAHPMTAAAIDGALAIPLA